MSLPYIHLQPCGCCLCEKLRLEAHTGSGLYIAADAGLGLVKTGVITWTLGSFDDGEGIRAGELVLVLRELEREEKGGHLDAVLILPLDGRPSPRPLVTSKRWLEPL